MARDLVLKIRVDDAGSAIITNWGDTTGKTLGKAESSYKRFARTTKQVAKAAGAALLAIKAATVVVATFAVRAASDFESSFAGVRKTVDATEAQFASLERGMRDLALQIPVNVNELNRIGEAAGQLGIETENIVGFTETMAQLGVTTNLSSEEAATALARLSNIMGTPQDQFDRMGSTIVELGNNFATTEAEIVEFGTRMAGAGNIIGLTEAQVLGFGTALSSVGIEAEAGGTAMQKVMIEIADAVASGGERLDQFAKIAGLSAEEFRIAFERDAAGAIVTFIEGLGRINEEGGNVFSVLEDVEFQNERVRRALLSAAGAGDLLREAISTGTAAWAENNALTKEAEQRFETFKSQWQLLKNAVNEVAIEVGQTLLPMFNALVVAVRSYINREGPQIADWFKQRLPGAINFTLDAFVFLAKGAALLLEGLKIAFMGIRNAWDLVVAGIQGGIALVLDGYNVLITAYRQFEEETIGQTFALDLLQGQLEALSAEMKGNASGAFERIRDRSQAAWQELGNVWEAAGKLEGGVEALRQRLLDAGAAGGDFTTQMLHAAPAAVNFAESLNAGGEQLLEGAAAARNYEDQLGELPPVLKAVESQTADATRQTIRWEDALLGVFDTIRTGKQWLDNLIGSVTNFIGSLLKGQGPLQAFGAALPGIGGLLGSVGGTGGGIAGNILGALGQGGPLAGLLGGGGAPTIAAPAAVNISGLVGGGAGAAGAAGAAGTGGGLMSSMSGLMTNPWTAVVAGGALAAFGVFKLLNKSREEARTERTIEQFSKLGPLSNETARAVADLSVELEKNGRQYPQVAAGLIKLGDILQETGIRDAAGFQFAAEKSREAVERFNQGIIKQEELVLILSDAFPILVENLDKADATGRHVFEDMLEKLAETGVEVEAITSMIEDQVGQLEEFIARAVSSNVDATNRFAQSFLRTLEGDGGAKVNTFSSLANDPDAQELLGLQFNAMAGEMQAGGASILEILEAFAPTLEAANEAGVKLGGQFAFLQELSSKMADEGVSKLVDRQGALNDMLRSTADLGMLTQESFDTFVRNAMSGHERLAGALGNENLALRVQGPLLGALRDIAAQYGFNMDDATRALIDNGESLGAIPAEVETVEDVLGDMRDILLGIAEAFGVDLPESVRRFRDRAAADMQNVVDNSATAGRSVRDNLLLDGPFRSGIGPHDQRFRGEGGEFVFRVERGTGDELEDLLADRISVRRNNDVRAVRGGVR